MAEEELGEGEGEGSGEGGDTGGEGGEGSEATAHPSNLHSDVIEEDREHPEHDGSVGAAQRLRIHVPEPNSTVTIGRHNGQIGYDGIAGITEKHVFFSAEEGSLTLQGEKQAVFQGMEKVFVLAKDEMLVGSKTETFVSGKTGVIIMAGQGPEPVMIHEEGEIPAEQTLHSMSHAHESIHQMESFGDNLAAMATSTAAIVGSLAGTVDLAFGLASVASTVATLSSGGATGALVMHGQNGVAMTSGANAVIGAAVGATMIAGLQAEMIATAKVEMAAGGMAVVLAGGKAAVEAGYKAELLGGVKAEVAARRGTAEVLGATIEIGSAVGHWTQLPTAKVEIAAVDEIALVADNGKIEGMASAEIKLATGIVMNGVLETEVASFELNAEHQMAEIKANKKVEIKVGDYLIEVTTTEIKIGKGSDPVVKIEGEKIQLISGETMVALNGSEVGMGVKSGQTVSTGIVFKKGASHVRIKASKVDVG